MRASIIVMERNRSSVDDTIAWLEEIGVKNIGVDHVRDFGRAQKSDACSMDELCGQCGQGTLCVDPEGRASPCIMSKKWGVGSVKDENLSSIFLSEEFASIREEIRNSTRIKSTMGGCNPNGPGCGPDGGGSCSPCSPNGHCGPNDCQPKRS